MIFRDAVPSDVDLLFMLLAEGVNWNGGTRVSQAEIGSDPKLMHYVADWGRSNDFGVVACDDDGTAVGAAWGRLFNVRDPGFGFVDEGTPELSMGVLQGHRGRGIGTTLLAQVIGRAKQCGFDSVSLSVEDGNKARNLYERLGFKVVGRVGNSDTMSRSTE